METKRENNTNYALVEEFMLGLLSLSPVQLTTFYCETCHERLITAEECRPKGPFQENTGICSHCDRCSDISNPHINRFLNERGLDLEYDEFDFELLRTGIDETIPVLRDWLIPNNYNQFRHGDKSYGEVAQFSWVNYGRKKQKETYRDRRLMESSKALLLPFYALCYSADRFAAAPILEPVEEAKITEAWDDYQFVPVPHEADRAGIVGRRISSSTFGRIRAFIASII